VLIGRRFALLVVVQHVLKVPIAGSLPLFLAAAACYLFAAASIGIFLGTLARSMPQLGLLDHPQHHAADDAFRRRLAAREHAGACRTSCSARRRPISSAWPGHPLPGGGSM
jgi:hypothetical protein